MALHGQLGGYDRQTAVGLVETVAVIWYTNFTFKLLRSTQERDDENRRRIHLSVSTALMAELVVLDQRLQELYRNPFDATVILTRPMLDKALSACEVFAPQSVSRMVGLAETLHIIEVQRTHVAPGGRAGAEALTLFDRKTDPFVLVLEPLLHSASTRLESLRVALDNERVIPAYAIEEDQPARTGLAPMRVFGMRDASDSSGGAALAPSHR